MKLKRRQFRDAEHERTYVRERLRLKVTDALVAAIGKSGSRKDVAKALGKTQQHVSQLLSGSRNMTLDTLADLAWAVDLVPVVNLAPIGVLDARFPERTPEVEATLALVQGHARKWSFFSSFEGIDLSSVDPPRVVEYAPEGATLDWPVYEPLRFPRGPAKAIA